MQYDKETIIQFLETNLEDFRISSLIPKYHSKYKRPSLRQFWIYVFNRWKEIQTNCLKYILSLTVEILSIKKQLKDESIKNKSNLENLLECYELYEKLGRKIMDSIVWEAFFYQKTYISKLHKGFEPLPITSTNLLDETKALITLSKAKDFFPIYTNLTSIVQVGDIFGISIQENHFQYQIIELKAGKKNKMILNTIETLNLSTKDIENNPFFKTKMDKHDFQQINRILRQKQRTEETVSLLTKDFVEYENGLKHHLIGNSKIKYFHDVLLTAINDSKKNKRSVVEIDNCVKILVYSNPINKIPKEEIFADVMKELESYGGKESAMIISDYSSVINKPECMPIFLLPFENGIIFDIIFDKIEIHLFLDIEKFIIEANKRGLKFVTEQITRKEKNTSQNFVIGKNKVIKWILDEKGNKVSITPNPFFNITNDLIYPNTIIQSFLENQKECEKLYSEEKSVVDIKKT